MNKTGYIYFASNPSMPGLLKVGVTNESPSERLPQLHTTGVPTPFVLEFSVRVIDPPQAEKRVHELLTQVKQASNREFFQVSLTDALARCLPHFQELLTSGSEHHNTQPTWRLSPDEEQVLWFVSQRMNHPNKPRRQEVQQRLKLSEMKAVLIFGNLIKRRFMRDGFEERSRQTGEFSHESYRVKVLKLERAGIQYLLDNNLITREKL
ncbi:MAG: GIY-YIG nuclease family protein [Verrucomicrobiota bacterium]